jgi:hypothetical protein
MATQTTTAENLKQQIRTLELTEVHIQTNQGTYTDGDPAFKNREVYETVGGARRETGPSEADAPGRMRHINAAAIAAARSELVRLREELKAARRADR